MARNITSRVSYLDKDFNGLKRAERNKASYVCKKIHDIYWKYEFVKKETYWLDKLKDFDRTPSVVKKEDHEFVMEYVGEPVTSENLPDDWKEQVEYILEKLEEHGCSHNDIKREEILVKDGKLHLVDFQHATHGRAEFFKGEHKIRGIMKREDRKSFEVELGRLEKKKCKTS